MTFRADNTEPSEITRLIGMVKDLDVCALNKEGWADYYYDGEFCFCHSSNEYNNERKTWDDLTNGIEEIEMQLANQLMLHPHAHNRLWIEGVVEPSANGIYVYRKAPGKNEYRAGLKGTQTQTYRKIIAWLHQVSKFWDVVYTNSMPSTAMGLVAYYDADQVPEEGHQTFHRVFKEFNYQVDPQVQKILNAGPKGFGVKAAESVAKHFGTAWRAWKSEPEEWMLIPGIGESTARKYLREMGRGDV